VGDYWGGGDRTYAATSADRARRRQPDPGDRAWDRGDAFEVSVSELARAAERLEVTDALRLHRKPLERTFYWIQPFVSF
jgi:hypothetical protein